MAKSQEVTTNSPLSLIAEINQAGRQLEGQMPEQFHGERVVLRDAITLQDAIKDVFNRAPKQMVMHVSEDVLKLYATYLTEEGEKISLSDYVAANKVQIFEAHKESLFQAFKTSYGKSHREAIIEALVVIEPSAEMQEEYVASWSKNHHFAVTRMMHNVSDAASWILGRTIHSYSQEDKIASLADKESMKLFRRKKAEEASDISLAQDSYYTAHYSEYKDKLLAGRMEDTIVLKLTNIAIGAKYEAVENYIDATLEKICDGFSLKGGSLEGVIFDNVTMREIDLESVNLQYTTGLVAFEDCNLAKTDFRAADTVRMSFQWGTTDRATSAEIDSKMEGMKFSHYTAKAQNKSFRKKDRETGREHVEIHGARQMQEAYLGRGYRGSKDGAVQLKSAKITIDTAFATGQDHILPVSIDQLQEFIDSGRSSHEFSFSDFIRETCLDQKAMASLKGQDLREMNLKGLNLACTDLSGSNMNDMDLEDTNLSSCNLEKAKLMGVELKGAKLTDVTAVMANFSGADMSGDQMERGNFDLAIFSEGEEFALLNGAQASWMKGRYMSADGIEATDAVFDYADLEGASLRKAQLARSTFIGANLKNVIADGASLELANLTDAMAAKISLIGADLTSAVATGISAKDANMQNAIISGLQAKYAQLTGANMEGVQQGKFKNPANFTGSVMRFIRANKADFTAAIMVDADARFAQLESAIMDSVKAEGIDLRDATLHSLQAKKADFTKSLLDRANLQYANLEEAILDKARAELANFANASLKKAKIRSAFLQSASLKNAQAQGADFTGSVVSATTDLRGLLIDLDTKLTEEMKKLKADQEQSLPLKVTKFVVKATLCATLIYFGSIFAAGAMGTIVAAALFKPVVVAGVIVAGAAVAYMIDRKYFDGAGVKTIKAAICLIKSSLKMLCGDFAVLKEAYGKIEGYLNKIYDLVTGKSHVAEKLSEQVLQANKNVFVTGNMLEQNLPVTEIAGSLIQRDVITAASVTTHVSGLSAMREAESLIPKQK